MSDYKLSICDKATHNTNIQNYSPYCYWASFRMNPENGCSTLTHATGMPTGS